MPPRGNSASLVFQGLAVLSLQDSLWAAPTKVLGDITTKILPNGQEIFLMHLREHVSDGLQAKEFLQTVSQEQGSNTS